LNQKDAQILEIIPLADLAFAQVNHPLADGEPKSSAIHSCGGLRSF